MKKIKNNILQIRITPGSKTYSCIFLVARKLFCNIRWQTNVVLEIINTNNSSIILSPLAGSSSVRKTGVQFDAEIKFKDNVYVVTRDYASRLQSFYNKKILNPDELGKCLLLSRCNPLTHISSIDEFLIYAEKKIDSLDKDKHLYTTENIAALYGLKPESVTSLNIDSDLDLIEKMLSVKLSNIRTNSTLAKARFSDPIELSVDHRNAIGKMLK